MKDFYTKRLKKIFVPMWLVLGVFLVLDAVALHRLYPFQSIVQNILGFFPRADVFLDIDSPLWYFTVILFYYLLFPLVFSKRLPILSSIVILLVGYLATHTAVSTVILPVVSVDVLKLYKLHYTAFPLGMCLAILLQYKMRLSVKLPSIPRTDALFAKLIVVVVALYLFGYTAIYSGVGGNPIKEQLFSLVSLGCLLIIFFLKNFYSRFLTLLGTYSYGIYLIHWPLMSRYDFLYHRLPASLATLLYLIATLILGIALSSCCKHKNKLLI